MKAIVQTDLHQPAQYTEAEKPTAGPGEVLISLKAAALNHRDVFIQQGLYPRIQLPVILGSDGAGVVTDVGEGVETDWLGQSVLINCSQHWGDNPAFYGPDFRILGMPQNGTFAEFVNIETRYLYPKPRHLTFEQAASLPLAGLTAWRAVMTRGGFQPTDKVLITGVGGGVALMALQMAVAAGAEVWVTSGSDEKLQRARTLGAHGGVNYRAADWSKELMSLTGGGKTGYFNLIIDSAAGPGFSRLIDVAAPGGRIVFYGGTTGNITDVVPAKVFFKQLTIGGTTMGTEQEFADMLRFAGEKQLVPIIDKVYSLAEAEQALRYLETNQQFGKIVLKINA